MEVLSPSVCTPRLSDRNETERGGERGRKMKSLSLYEELPLFCLMCVFLISVLLGVNVNSVSALLSTEMSCQSNSAGVSVMSFSSAQSL